MNEKRRPQSVLFACRQNAIRSPMAEAIAKALFGRRLFITSAGVRAGEPDPFVAAVLEEEDIAPPAHPPRALETLEEEEGLAFDVIITLASEAHHKVLKLTHGLASEVEYWPTPDPSLASGNRDQILQAYRQIRDGLTARIRERFGSPA